MQQLRPRQHAMEAVQVAAAEASLEPQCIRPPPAKVGGILADWAKLPYLSILFADWLM